MYYESANIINAMNYNMFKIKNVDEIILQEVPFFRSLLIQNINNLEVFHEYVNKLQNTWKSIINDNFNKLIIIYNQVYYVRLLREQEMIKVATEIDAEQLFEDLTGLGVSPKNYSKNSKNSKNSVDSLTDSMRRNTISKSTKSRKLPIFLPKK